MKKITPDQMKQLYPLFMARINKIKDQQKSMDLQPFVVATADICQAAMWIFSDQLPYQHIAG